MKMTPVLKIEEQINQHVIPPFVYSYPPRSAYRTLPGPLNIFDVWTGDNPFSPSRPLNLYIHVPFCRYKCGFCNLYTITSRSTDIYSAYASALCRELELLTPVFEERDIVTVYIGGGTPSVLSTNDFSKIFSQIDRLSSNWRSSVREVCIEASPDSLANSDGLNKLAALKDLGLTRVNLGVQSLEHSELRNAGRAAADVVEIYRAVDTVRQAGISNLSTDLIIGFAGQTDASWESSVSSLVRLAPETISTYFLTLRPDSWFSLTPAYATYTRGSELYHRYDLARAILSNYGYEQETNVRYKLPGRGGYIQKVLQFSGVPVLGVGLGARSYTNTVDYLRWNPLAPQAEALHRYIMKSSESTDVNYGFVYTDAERVRKRLALDLFDLNLAQVPGNSRQEYSYIYADLLQECYDIGLIERPSLDRWRLTSSGYKYRDIISWAFFSPTVCELDRDFYRKIRQVRLASSRPGTQVPCRSTNFL